MTDIEKELGMTFLEIYEIQKKLSEGTIVYCKYADYPTYYKEDTREYYSVHVDFKEKEFVLLNYEPMVFYKFEEYKKTWFLEEDMNMNLNELYAVYTSLCMTMEDCVIPKDLEQLANLRLELEKIIYDYKKIGYTDDLVNKYMKIKSQLLKLNAI